MSDGEQALMALAARRLLAYDHCPGPEPVSGWVDGVVCGRCAFGLVRYNDKDWVHSGEEVEQMRRVAAGGSWLAPA